MTSVMQCETSVEDFLSCSLYYRLVPSLYHSSCLANHLILAHRLRVYDCYGDSLKLRMKKWVYLTGTDRAMWSQQRRFLSHHGASYCTKNVKMCEGQRKQHACPPPPCGDKGVGRQLRDSTLTFSRDAEHERLGITSHLEVAGWPCRSGAGEDSREVESSIGKRERAQSGPVFHDAVFVQLPVGFGALRGRRLCLGSWLKSWTSSQPFRKPWQRLRWGLKTEAIFPPSWHPPPGSWLGPGWVPAGHLTCPMQRWTSGAFSVTQWTQEPGQHKHSSEGAGNGAVDWNRLKKKGTWTWTFAWDYVLEAFHCWAGIEWGACKGIETYEQNQAFTVSNTRPGWDSAVALGLFLHSQLALSWWLSAGVIIILPPENVPIPTTFPPHVPVAMPYL